MDRPRTAQRLAIRALSTSGPAAHASPFFQSIAACRPGAARPRALPQEKAAKNAAEAQREAQELAAAVASGNPIVPLGAIVDEFEINDYPQIARPSVIARSGPTLLNHSALDYLGLRLMLSAQRPDLTGAVMGWPSAGQLCTISAFRRNLAESGLEICI